MRMRRRHNLKSRMERCAKLLVSDPYVLKGQWGRSGRRLLLEIGCGKGSFTCALAEKEADSEVVAIEKVPDAMILAMERAEAAKLTNIHFLDFDAANLREIFAPAEVSRIYLNFSDPWPKSRDAKFRLTAPGFLRSYADILPAGGEIHLKTDNRPFFEWSLGQLQNENWLVREKTYDLHAKGPVGILSDYEKRFLQEGIPICRLVAVRQTETLDSGAGIPERLRDAALSDARGNCADKNRAQPVAQEVEAAVQNEIQPEGETEA